MSVFSQLISGASGKPSTMRVSTLFVVVAVMGTWSFVSVSQVSIQNLPESVVVVLLGALGSKLAQRTVEQKPKAE